MNFKFQFLLTSLLFVLFLIGIVHSQGTGKINLAVMDLEALDVSSSARRALSDRLRNELFNSGRFAVMERNKMDEILKEQGFQQTGCTNDECIIEAGRLLGVDRMIAGSIGKVGTIFTVSLRMIDIETGRIMLSKTEDCINCSIEQVLTTSLKNVSFKMAGLSAGAEPKPVIRNEQIAGQGDFYFKSTPTAAKVFIDNQSLPGVTPVMKEGVPAGTHQVRMEKGYYSGSQTVFLEPNEFKRVEMFLVKAKGALKIVTTPFEADIFFDNKSMGASPQTFTALDAGEHILKLSKQGYLDHEQVALVEGGKVKRLNIVMEKIKPATLKITSLPPNCDVYVNKQYKGKTPVAVHDLMFGTVQVKLTNPMYVDWQESIVLGNGEVKEINPELVKKTGKLIIKSDPVAADVEVDGIMRGQTPLTLSDVEYGTHTVKISKTDYQPQQEKVELVSATAKTIQVHLVEAKGLLSIYGNPVGADIYFLNNPILKGTKLPLTNYQLDKGLYRIEVKAKGYETYSDMVRIFPNAEKSLNVNLNPKTRSKALKRSIFIPGLGQYYAEKPGKGTLFLLSEVAAILGVYGYNNKYNTAIKDYNSAQANYSTAIDQTDINNYYNQMETKYDKIESAEKMRNIFIGAAVGVWLWNVADAALFGPDTEKNTRIGKIGDKKLKLCSGQSNGVSRVGVSYNF